MLSIHSWINALRQSPEEKHSPHLLIQCWRSHLWGEGHLPCPWAWNSSCTPCPGASPCLCGWPCSGSALNQLSRLSSVTKNALGTASPCSQRPLEKTGKWRNAHGPRMGMKRWTPVSLPHLPEGSDGQLAQKHQQKGHSAVPGISWWKWRWIFRGFLTGQQAKEGKSKDLYFGLTH